MNKSTIKWLDKAAWDFAERWKKERERQATPELYERVRIWSERHLDK